MASGFEKSPDYGGPEPTRWGTVLIIAIILGVAAAYLWLAS